MNGVGGKQGWAWIFILEGIFTALFGISSFFLLPASPATAKFFTEEEKAYVEKALKLDGATAQDEATDAFSWREVGMAFKLPQVWMLAVIFFFDGEKSFVHLELIADDNPQEPCFSGLPSGSNVFAVCSS